MALSANGNKCKGKKKYEFTESIQEAIEKATKKQRRRGPTTRLSLTAAMTAIVPFVTVNQAEAKGILFPVMIANIPILYWSTFSSIFDNSDYYVDYDHVFQHQEKFFKVISCLVREKSNPTHVVADIAFSDPRDKRIELTGSVLRTLPIIDDYFDSCVFFRAI